MRELVHFAATLARLAGGAQGAQLLVRELITQPIVETRTALLTRDEAEYVKAQASDLGLLGDDGCLTLDRAATLTLILEVIRNLPAENPPVPVSQPLVFTLPMPASAALTARQRLDGLVQDVITSSRHTLLMGGPFWNDRGFSVLRPALEAALSVRGVALEMIAHRQGPERDPTVSDFAAAMRKKGPTRLFWYSGPPGSLMHAKFCVGDGETGYFGTANLTSFGLQGHVEIGVRLSPRQCIDLARMVSLLRDAGLILEESATA